MKTKIKESWVDYDYVIACSHTLKDDIMKTLEKNLKVKVEYLGKSKVVKIDDVVKQLPKRSLFFKFISL